MEPTEHHPTDDGTHRRGPAAEAEQAYVEMTDEEWADASEPNFFPDGATIAADRRDAAAAHDAGEVDEDAAANAPSGPVAPSVSETEKESMERGANIRGEGQITPD